MGNLLRKKVLVSQQAEEVVAGEETLLLSLEFKNKTKDVSCISDTAPVVEVYSGDETESVQHEIHYRFHHVDQHRCELYITIERRMHEEDRAKVKLKLDSGYALSKECVFVKVLERETSERIGLTPSSSRNGVCKPKKRARRKQGNITLQNAGHVAYPYYGYMHNSAIRGYNAIRNSNTEKEHDTSSTQGEHDTSSTQSDVSQSTSTTPALNNNTISSASVTNAQRIGVCLTPTSTNTYNKQQSISRPRPIARKSTLSHSLALKYTSVSPTLNGHSCANELNDSTKNTATKITLEAVSTVRDSYHTSLSSMGRKLTSQCGPSPTHNTPRTSVGNSSAYPEGSGRNTLIIQPAPTRSASTDAFNKTTTVSRPSTASTTTRKGILSNSSALRNTPTTAAVLDACTPTTNDANATDKTKSERNLTASTSPLQNVHSSLFHTPVIPLLDLSCSTQPPRPVRVASPRLAPTLLKTACEDHVLVSSQTTSKLTQPPRHSTGPDHFQKGTTANQSFVSSPKATITPQNPTALKNRSTNQAENNSSPISTSKTNATGNTDSKRKSVSACAVRDHSVSKDSRTTRVRSLHSNEQRLTYGANERSEEQPFKVSQPGRYFLTNPTFAAERSSSDTIIQSDIHQLYYNTWTIFEADIIDGEQHATNVDIDDVISSSYGVQFDNTYTASDGRLRIRLRAFYQYLDSFEMYITLRCWNNSAEAVIEELVHVNRPADVLRMPAPSVSVAVTKNPKPLKSSALHNNSKTPLFDNSSPKQQTNLDRSGLVNRPSDVLRMTAPSVHDAVTRKPKPSNTSALHSTSTYPIFDTSSSKQQTKLDRSVSPQPQHPTPSKTATGNLPFASSSTARKLTNQCNPSSTDSTPTSADYSTSSSSATGQNKLVIQPAPARSTSTVVLNKIPTAGRSSITSPTVRKGTSSNPSALRNTPTPLVLNGCTPTSNNASVTDKTKSERKLSSLTSSLQGVNSPLFHASAISLGNSSGSTQPTSPDRLASPRLAPTRLKSAREDHVSCPTTTSKLAQCNPSAHRSTLTDTKDNSRSTSQDLLVIQPLRYSMCTNLLKDTANPTAAPSPTAKEIPNSKAVQNRSANETLGRSIPTSHVNATRNPNSTRKSASKMRDSGLNTTSTTSLLFPPPSVDHSAIEVTSPDHRPVKAGETLVFKIHVRDENGRKVNSSVHYKLLVKLRNKTIPSDRKNPTIFQVTPQCSGKNSVSFSIDGKEKIWHFAVLPSKPASLRNVKFTPEQSRLDPSFRPQNDLLLYDDVWATLEADIQDKFGNVVHDVDNVQVSSTSSNIQFDTCTATDGKFNLRLKASVLYHQETKEIRITLKPTDSEDETVLTRKVDVVHAPCSSTFSRVKSDTNVCTVGKEHKIQVEIMNVFNNPVPTQAGVTCVVYAKTLEAHFKAGEYSCCDSDVIYITENKNGCGEVQLDATIIPKRVGPRQIMVYLNGEQMDSSEANFEVHPNLRMLQCRSIRRLQREGEHAILEAMIEDCGGNSIALDTINDIRLVRISGPLNGLACQSSKIQSNVVLIEHTLLEDERYFLRLETDDGDVIHKFEVDTHDDIPESGDAQDKQFLLYSDTMCRITKVRTQWSGVACRGATKRDIKGPDCAHLINMKRVLNLRENVELTVDRQTGDTQIRFRANVSTKFLETCRELVLHLLRGDHYRKKASEVARHRMLWKERIEILEEREYNLVPSRTVLPERLKSIPWTLKHCRRERDTYGHLMNEYNRQASVELYAFFNYERQENEVDLHGLFVADEKKYAALRKKLEDKEVKDPIIEKIISRCRWEGDEAIRKLEDKLRSFDLESARESGEPWIEIVVGAGNHSRERQKIRPKVENFLRERSTEFAPVNKGSLVVTLEKYDGPEPCCAEYYCQECHRCWRSRQSWSNKSQACESCKVTKGKEVDCWPIKQSAEERSNSNWSGERPPRNRGEMQHKVDLCKECKRLGHPCYKLKSNRRSARRANP